MWPLVEVPTAIMNQTEAEDSKASRELRAHLVRYEVEPSLEVIKVVKIEDVDELTEVIKLEVTTAPEVTALTEASTEVTKEVPMIKTVQEEEQEDVGEEGVPMGTSSGEPTRITHTEIKEIT